MEQENSKVEAPGGLEKEVVPPPPRKRGRQQKILLIGLAGLVVLAAVIFYYSRFVAPYESTDDAFIDGYVTRGESARAGTGHAAVGDGQSGGQGRRRAGGN